MHSSVFTIVAAFFVAGSPSVIAAPTSDNDVARSTSSIKWEADMIFDGPVIAGGPNVNISGKYDEILAQVLVLNPEYKPEDFESSATKERREKLARLAKRNKDGIICDIVVGGCKANWLDVDVMISQPVPSIRIAMPAGPGYCVKVATINTAGFWACNDNNYYIEPALPYLITYVSDIYGVCGTDAGVNGQEFDSDNYNVIVACASSCVGAQNGC